MTDTVTQTYGLSVRQNVPFLIHSEENIPKTRYLFSCNRNKGMNGRSGGASGNVRLMTPTHVAPLWVLKECCGQWFAIWLTFCKVLPYFYIFFPFDGYSLVFG